MKQTGEERLKYVRAGCSMILVLMIAEFVLLDSLLSSDALLPSLLPTSSALPIVLAILFALLIVGSAAWLGYLLTHGRRSGTYGTAHLASKQEVRQAGVVKANDPSSRHSNRSQRLITLPGRFALLHPQAGPGTDQALLPFVAPQQLEERPAENQEQEAWFELGTYRNLNIGLAEEQQEGHVLVIAPTKRGKTAGIIIPNLLKERGSRSLFIHDIKHELIDLCIGALAEYHECFLISPTRPDESNGYNPLAHVTPESLSGARNIAECIVRNTGNSKEPFWDNAARLLLTAAIVHLRTAEPDASFSRVTDLCTLSMPELVKTIEHSPSALAQRVGASFIKNVAAEPRLQSNVMTDIATRLFDMMDPTIEQITSYDDLDFQHLSEQPSALFLHIPPYEATRLRWLSSCLIMQLIHYLFEHPHTKRFAFYLDELANAGYIPNYLEYISYIRSAGVAFLQVVQDFGQLERIYERHGRDTILANSGTQIFLSGIGQVEAEYASRVMGETTVLARSENEGQQQVSYAEAARKLMNPDEIRSLPLWDLLVLVGNAPPFIVKNTPYFKQPELQARIRLPYVRPTRVRPVPSNPANISSPSETPSPLLTSEQAPRQSRGDDKYFMSGNEEV